MTDKELNNDGNAVQDENPEQSEMGEAVDTKEIETLLEDKDNEIADLNNKIARLQADFQNFKKRSDKEKEMSVGYGIEKIVRELLPILDNFQRAVKMSENTENSFFQGIQMIEVQLLELLVSNSIHEIDAVGEKFDPNLHHAVSVVESDLEPEKVVDVLQKGYKFNDKVIRPAMVIVSK